MIRKLTIPTPIGAAQIETAHIDVGATATVIVTSESPENVVDFAFDGLGGPGGTRWVANDVGEQSITLAFDTPQSFNGVRLEVEESQIDRTQQVTLSTSHDSGQSYRELLQQEFNFSPSGSTFERENWTIFAHAVTHFRVTIKPDKGGKPCRASITSLMLTR